MSYGKIPQIDKGALRIHCTPGEKKAAKKAKKKRQRKSEHSIKYKGWVV